MKYRSISNTVFIAWFLCCVGVLCSTMLPAQSEKARDSLITIQTEFSNTEPIAFTVKIEPQRANPSASMRVVQTHSCSCGSSDFYYSIYRVPGKKNPSKRRMYRAHFEKPNAPRCLCKSQMAALQHKGRYTVAAIPDSGNYVIEIEGPGFIMISNVFRVKSK